MGKFCLRVIVSKAYFYYCYLLILLVLVDVNKVLNKKSGRSF